MIDLSDGLAGDAQHLAVASGVRMVLDLQLVPVHPDLPVEDAPSLAMSGGEDYELCFVSPPGVTGPLAAEFRERFGIGLTCVGRVEEGTGIGVVGATDGQDHLTGGFDHFSAWEGSC
jgi:thiamine-monophosphate kinase